MPNPTKSVKRKPTRKPVIVYDRLSAPDETTCYWCGKQMEQTDRYHWLEHLVHRKCHDHCGHCVLCGAEITLAKRNLSTGIGYFNKRKPTDPKCSFPTFLGKHVRICEVCHDKQATKRHRPLESAKFKRYYRKFLLEQMYQEVKCTFISDDGGRKCCGPVQDHKELAQLLR